MLKAPEPEKYGESSGGENRSQGNVSGKRYNQQKDSEGDCNWDWSNRKERADRRGNAFTAVKAKPQWEHVSDDCKQRRKSGNGIGSAGVRGGVWAADDHLSNQHSCESFQHVEQQ